MHIGAIDEPIIMDEGIEGESDTYFVLVFIVSVNSLTYTTIVYNHFNNLCNYIVC